MRGSDDGSASASSWRRCAANNTVVATVASRAFAPALLELGGSAARVGFPCVLVLPMDDGLLPLPTPPTLQLLPVPTPSLLPRQQWCNTNANKYGHRRAQLHRVRLWRMVLAAGLDLLAHAMIVGDVATVKLLQAKAAMLAWSSPAGTVCIG